MHFLDPTNDLAFKKVFGDESKKELLISFLNGILELKGKKTIQEIVILNPYQAPQIKNSKQTIIDVRCRDQSGAEYIVEMQIFKDKDFEILDRYQWNREELEFYDNVAIRKEQEAGQVKEGIDQGIKIGRREGKKEGREEGLREVAKKMLKQGMAVKQICQITGLKPEDVKKLK